MFILLENIFTFYGIFTILSSWNIKVHWEISAEWFGAIGSFIAIMMVIYQVNQSKKQFEKQKVIDREREFSKERPFFIMKIVPFKNRKNTFSSHDFGQSVGNIYEQSIRIKNITDKPMLVVSCLLVKKQSENGWEEIERFQIDQIQKDKTVYFASRYLNANGVGYKILVYYHTAIRERTRLVFDILESNKLEYDGNNKQLENQGKDWVEEGKEFKNFNHDYDTHVNNFVESQVTI